MILCQNFHHTYHKSCTLSRCPRTHLLSHTGATHRRLALTIGTDAAADGSFIGCHTHTATLVVIDNAIATVATEEVI